MPDVARPVLLVHGAWHGAWCWAALQADLDRRGVPSYAVDLPGRGASAEPLGDLYADAARVVAALAAVAHDSGVVLAGHSYGGAVVTQAAADAPDGAIAHLLYVAGFALDDGESVASFLSAAPRVDVVANRAAVRRDDGTTVVDPALAAAALFGTTATELVPAAMARLSPQSVAGMRQPVHGSPRHRLPSTYLRCRRDETVHPDHQRLLATRCDDVVELDTDHSPYLSATPAVADVVERLARTPSTSAGRSA